MSRNEQILKMVINDVINAHILTIIKLITYEKNIRCIIILLKAEMMFYCDVKKITLFRESHDIMN